MNNDWKPTEINEGQPTNWEPKRQTNEEVADGLRNAMKQAIKDGVIDATPYLKQMTSNKEIELLKQQIKMLQSKLSLLEEIETHKSPVEEAYKDWCGEYPSGSPSEDVRWDAFLNGYWATQPKAVPVEEPQSKSMDEVVDRLVKKYQAQKLWNRVRDELGYSIDCCDEIVDLVEKWLPKEQSAAGSQNVDVELLVDGFNDCVRKMKGTLR
jgi:hypothetical protein